MDVNEGTEAYFAGKKSMKIVIIDNGHGEETPGKRSPEGSLREYQWAREVARLLQHKLSERGLNSLLLVQEDADIPLSLRCARANAICKKYGKENVLLVSIHLNAAGNGSKWMNARGWEAYTSPGRTKADMLAECIYEAASKLLPPDTPIRTDFSDGDSDKEARFAILTGTRCPAVLTENLFMDNPEDCEYLMSREGKETIALLHAEAIEKYIKM